MTTWAELLGEIRIDLQDTNETSPRFTSRDIYISARDGVRDYSMWFPKMIDRLELVAENGKFPLPEDFIEEHYVECPIDTYLEKQDRRPGVRYIKSRRAITYHIQSGAIYLSCPVNDGDVIYLTYGAAHDVPADENDSEFVFTIRELDIELIRFFVRGRLFTRMRGKQASLDRFKVTGRRDDNPIIFEVEDLMRDYKDGIAMRYGGGTISMYRRGRGR